jgi:type IV secretion system protein VirB10
MASSDIVSPNGLDLSPKPPSPVRVSKRAGLLFLLVGAIVLGLILYGVVTRGDRQLKLGFQMDETKGLTAATDAGKMITSKVPASALAQGRGPASEELVTEAAPSSAASPAAVSPTYHQAPIYYPPQPTQPQYREPSAEDRRRELAYQREQEALNAPTTAREAFSPGQQAGAVGSSGPTPQGDLAQMTQLLQAMQGSAGGPRSANLPGAISNGIPRITLGSNSTSQAEEYKLQNAQDEKEAFLEKARAKNVENYLGSTRVKPLSKYEIKTGWDIPAILEQAMNSDLPGEIKALVRENVYDTATGKYLLIPQGSRLVGSYDSRVGYGQDGVQVAWNRIIFPDASSINLEGMAGQDAKGNTGLRYDVDNHYKRLIGMAVLTSAFSAAFQLSQTRRGTVFTYPSPGEIAGSAAAGNLSQIGAEVTRRNLNIQPTVKVPIGYRFNVRVNRDLLFESPYRAMQP